MRVQNHNQRACGFTVLELIVAIAVAMIVMGIAVPSFLAWLPTLRLSSAARQVAIDLQVARMKAISQNASFQISFGSTTYVFQKCTPACANDSGNIVLPEGITVSASATPQFLPRGTANTALTITITLSNTKGEQKQVEVVPVGRVRLL